MNRHVSNDELIDGLYGLSSEDHAAHLAECAECSNRLEKMSLIKERLTVSEPVSREFLAAQRRRIYARLGTEPSAGLGWMRGAWAPALAATALLAIGIVVHRPEVFHGAGGAETATLHADADDAQLFADVYSLEQSSEPSVAAPIHTLFEDNQ